MAAPLSEEKFRDAFTTMQEAYSRCGDEISPAVLTAALNLFFERVVEDIADDIDAHTVGPHNNFGYLWRSVLEQAERMVK